MRSLADSRRPDIVYHIADAGSWPPTDGVYRPATLAADGFVHASGFAQLRGVATSLFTGRSDLPVLEIDCTMLNEPPVWEDLYNLGQDFPHIYGPIPANAVVGTLELGWDQAGGPLFRRSGLPPDPASTAISWTAAGVDTVPLLARLNSQLIEDEGHDNPLDRAGLETRMQEFLTTRYTAYLLSMGEVVAGYALCNHDAEPPYIRQFFVDRGMRRLGIGTRAFHLLQHHLGTTVLAIDVLPGNGRAVRFWHSLGFKDRSIRMHLQTELDDADTPQAGGGGAPSTPTREADRRPMPGRTVTPDARGAATESAVQAGLAESRMVRLQRLSGHTSRASQFLSEQIKAFNDKASVYHHHVREPGAIEDLAVMLVDEAGNWCGGIGGSVAWDWLSIDDFWVTADLRGMGFGLQLLQEIESMAKERGARHAKLWTFAFQAPGFYQKYGYQVAGKVEGFPPNSSLYWLRKDL